MIIVESKFPKDPDIFFPKKCLTRLKRLVIFIMTLCKVSSICLKYLATVEQIALVSDLKVSLVL